MELRDGHRRLGGGFRSGGVVAVEELTIWRLLTSLEEKPCFWRRSEGLVWEREGGDPVIRCGGVAAACGTCVWS